MCIYMVLRGLENDRYSFTRGLLCAAASKNRRSGARHVLCQDDLLRRRTRVIDGPRTSVIDPCTSCTITLYWIILHVIIYTVRYRNYRVCKTHRVDVLMIFFFSYIDTRMFSFFLLIIMTITFFPLVVMTVDYDDNANFRRFHVPTITSTCSPRRRTNLAG